MPQAALVRQLRMIPFYLSLFGGGGGSSSQFCAACVLVRPPSRSQDPFFA